MERLTTRNIAGVAVYKLPFECEICGFMIEQAYSSPFVCFSDRKKRGI